MVGSENPPKEVGFQNQFLENAGKNPQTPDTKAGRRSYPWPEIGGKELDFIGGGRRDRRDSCRREGRQKKKKRSKKTMTLFLVAGV